MYIYIAPWGSRSIWQRHADPLMFHLSVNHFPRLAGASSCDPPAHAAANAAHGPPADANTAATPRGTPRYTPPIHYINSSTSFSNVLQEL